MAINYDKYSTYIACSSAFTPGATPQDVITLSGNATTNVYVLKMGLSTSQTTEGLNAWYIAKRSTANSGGTSAGLTEVPLRSTQSTAASAVLQYTANPTAGTLVGNVWTGFLTAGEAAIAAAGSDNMVVDFESELGQPIALLSADEVIAWNFGGAALPTGLSVLGWIMWCEASKT